MECGGLTMSNMLLNQLAVTDAELICYAFLVLVVVVASVVESLRRTKALVCRWALEQNLVIVEMSRCILRQGPFFWVTNMDAVFRLTVKDRTGVVRRGWVRAALLTGKVAVKWNPAGK